MEIREEDTVRANMDSLRLISDREIPIQQQRMGSLTASFRKSLESIGARARETVQSQGEVEMFLYCSIKCGGFLQNLGFLARVCELA